MLFRSVAYLYVWPACMCGLPVCVAYLYVWPTCMCGLPVCVACLYVWPTCMCGLPVCVAYLYMWPACMCGLPVCVAYLYMWNGCHFLAIVTALVAVASTKPMTMKYISQRDNNPFVSRHNSFFVLSSRSALRKLFDVADRQFFFQCARDRQAKQADPLLLFLSFLENIRVPADDGTSPVRVPHFE